MSTLLMQPLASVMSFISDGVNGEISYTYNYKAVKVLIFGLNVLEGSAPSDQRDQTLRRNTTKGTGHGRFQGWLF